MLSPPMRCRASPFARMAASATQVTDHLVDNHTDGAYAVLRFAARCPAAPEMLQVGYDLFFGLDPQHRGLLRLLYGGETRSAIFSPVSAQQRFRAQPRRSLASVPAITSKRGSGISGSGSITSCS